MILLLLIFKCITVSLININNKERILVKLETVTSKTPKNDIGTDNKDDQYMQIINKI